MRFSSKHNLLYLVAKKAQGILLIDVGTYEENQNLNTFQANGLTRKEANVNNKCDISNAWDAKLYSTDDDEILFVSTIDESTLCVFLSFPDVTKPSGWKIEESPENGEVVLPNDCNGKEKDIQILRNFHGDDYVFVWCYSKSVTIFVIEDSSTGKLGQVFTAKEAQYPAGFDCSIIMFVTGVDAKDDTKMHLFSIDNKEVYWHLIFDHENEELIVDPSDTFNNRQGVKDVSVIDDTDPKERNLYFLTDNGIDTVHLDQNTNKVSIVQSTDLAGEKYQIWSPIAEEGRDDIVVFLKDEGYVAYDRYTYTHNPTPEPTEEPTPNPTVTPTLSPTFEPTLEPTEIPTNLPTEEPTQFPSATPTMAPTNTPTLEPTSNTTIFA